MTKELEFVPTGSKVIDNLLEGGWATRSVSGTFSAYDVGKTWLMIQTACYLWKEYKKGTVYIDTEGYFVRKDTQERFYNFFRKRWKFDDTPNIKFVFPSDIMDLGKYLGKGIKILGDPKSPMLNLHLWDITDKFHSPLAEDVEEVDAGLIVLDSLSQPIKEEIPVPPRQNFPCRSSTIDAILGRISPIAKKKNIAAIATVHESKDPARGPYDTGKPVGGSALGFFTKYLVQIRGQSKEEKRIVSIYRFPGKQSTRRKDEGEEVTLAKDLGFVP